MGNTGDTNADTDEEETQFWNQSINKLEANSKYDGYSNLGKDLRTKPKNRFKTKKEALPQAGPREIKWNKKRDKRLHRMYRQSLVVPFYRKKKTVKKWGDKRYKLYNIQALWKHNCDLGLIFDISSQQELDRSSDLRCNVDILHPLNKVLPSHNLS